MGGGGGKFTSINGSFGGVIKSAAFSLSSSGTVIAAVAGKRIKVFAVKLVVASAMTVKFRDGANTDLEGAQSLGTNGGYVESVTPPYFLFATATGNSLDLVLSVIGTAAGRISYWDDDEN